MSILFNSQLLVPFNPRQVANLVYFGDDNDPAGNGTQPAVSAAVATEVDKSVQGLSFTQASGSFQPTFGVASNQGSLLYDGSDDRLSRTYNALLNSQDVTYFCIARPTLLGPTVRATMGTRGISGGNIYGFTVYKFASNDALFPNQWGAVVGNGTATQGNLAGAVAVAGTSALICLNASGGTMTLYVNNVAYNSVSYVSQAGHTTQPFYIGCGDNGLGVASNFWNGRIFKTAIYNRSLSAAEQLYVARGLAAPCGIII